VSNKSAGRNARRQAGDEGVIRDEVEQLLEAAGRRGLSRSDLESWAAERGVGKSLATALSELTASAVAVMWNRRWIAVRHTDWIAGKLRAQARGGALLLTGGGGEAGYFVPPGELKGAVDADLVLVRPVRREGRGHQRASRRGRLPEATVVKVLARGAREIVGFIDEKLPRELVPFDSRSRLRVTLAESRADLAGHFAVAGLHPNVQSGAAKVSAAHLEDLGSIDDFDDAISIQRYGAGDGFQLAVHIADVAHYVPASGILDLEAYQRGTSVYFPDRAIPMIPEALSNGLCSLKPGVDRLAMTAFLEFSPTGELLGRSFAESVIRSDHRFTYDEVSRILAGPGSEKAAETVGDPRLLELLEVAQALMQTLLRRRTERGSIDFDLPEGDVILDTDGVTIGIKPGERNVAHRIIEEFMIAANEAVAAELVGAEEPALYRIHTEPDRSRFEELRSFLEPLGVPLELGTEELHPSHLQEVLRRVEGHPEETFVATLILRAMKRAVYDPDCKGHYALASRTYTHFTSPIRRYPDLVVHRALKRRLSGKRLPEDAKAALRARLEAIAEHTSATERRAERAERTLLQWKVVRLLAPREGEIFSGRVTGVQPFGLFVQLEGYYADGLLPIAALTDDYYTFEAEKHRLVGRRGRTLRLADRLDVKLTVADPMRRMLTLGLPD
jgi:exoribonuclease R